MKQFIDTSTNNFILHTHVYSQDAWRFLGKAGFSPDAKMTAITYLDNSNTFFAMFQYCRFVQLNFHQTNRMKQMR